jgi:ABC-type glycerol-3-phosphate transport system substrate-binding protein
VFVVERSGEIREEAGKMGLYTRRRVVQMGAAGAAAFALAGCAGDDDGGGGGGQADLLYDWSYLGTGVGKFWQAVGSKSPDVRNATGVPLETLFQTVQSQNTAKAGADLFAYYPDYFAYKLKAQDSIIAVDDFVKSGEPAHWLLASAKFDNRQWGVPVALEVAVMVINRRHFEKAGVDVDKEFESWDHFIEACDRLKAAGITPIQASSSDSLGSDKLTQLLTLQVCDTPTDLLRGVIGELPITHPVFSHWMEQLPVLRDQYMNPDPQNDTEQVSNTKFLNGEGGIQIMYTGPIFEPGVGSEFEVVGFPKSSAKFNRRAIGSSDTMHLAAYAKHKDAAGRVLDYVHAPEQLNLWWELTRLLPPDDRFDSSVLPPAAKATWEFILDRKDDVYSVWWVDNFFPPQLSSYYLGVPAGVMAGGSTDEARQKADSLFSGLRKQNPDEVDRIKQSIPVLDRIVQESVAKSG